MRRLRRSGLPSLLLILVMGLAVLFLEAGHSLAHRHALNADLHHAVEHAVPHAHGEMAVDDGHVGGDHPHVELLGTPGAKPLLAHAVATQTVIRLADDLGTERQVRLVVLDDLTPGCREHGPPPPSRAPPLA